MDYKSKYTASEIDAKLSQVFDSTLQIKEVEVSADTTITPDEGFLGLKEVNVKVNVSNGGNENSGEESDSNTVYINIIQLFDNNTVNTVTAFSSSVQQNNGDVVPLGLCNNAIVAAKLNLSDRVIYRTGSPEFDGTIEQALLLEGIDLNTLPQITKEEFYAPPKPYIRLESEGKMLLIDGNTGTVIENNGYGVISSNGVVGEVRGLNSSKDSWFMVTFILKQENRPITTDGMFWSTSDNKMYYFEPTGSGEVQFQLQFGSLIIYVS